MAELNFSQYQGRVRINTSFEEVNTGNFEEFFDEIEPTLITNIEQSIFLDEYYRGVQDIVKRNKIVRPEINNKLVENKAYEIVNFKSGYQYGEGIFYASRYGDEGTREKVEMLNVYNSLINKQKTDIEHLVDAFITGRGFRLVTVSDEEDIPYEVHRIDATLGDMVYTREAVPKKVAFVYHQAGVGEEEDITMVYTDSEVITRIGEDITSESHSLGVIPIVVTELNSRRMGAFEPVLGMLEAVNLLQSDRMNAIEQFVQSIMILKDVEFEEGFDTSTISQLGVAEIKTSTEKPNAGIELLTQELNQLGSQTLKSDIVNMINDIVSLPGRQSGGGGDTGLAVELREGWANAETYATTVDPFITSSEMEVAKLIITCYNLSETGELLPNEVEVKYNRAPRVDKLATTQAMLNQQAFGIEDSIIIKDSGMYADPGAVFTQSIESLKAAAERKVADGNKTNIENGVDPVEQRELTDIPTNTN